MFGGEIDCKSKKPEYGQFILSRNEEQMEKRSALGVELVLAPFVSHHNRQLLALSETAVNTDSSASLFVSTR